MTSVPKTPEQEPH